MRIKEELQKKDKGTMNNPSFEECLKYYKKEQISKKLSDMKKNPFHKNKAQNNPYYQPLQGA